VLVATDCLSEGINLQDGFNAVIHYDLPWNPNRLEQREGRVDRFGQTSGQVKAVLLYGADNPVDGAVLNVLLRKARHIHKSLGITVPVPVDSESVMDTVIKALFFHETEAVQPGLFDELPVVEVHRKWDHAVERERKSRTRFAQHAIKPDEVAKELEITDSVLGNPHVVERFITTSCQRFGCHLSKANGYWKINVADLPMAVLSKLSDDKVQSIAFDQPVPKEIAYVGRNHPLTVAISEYLFDTAMQQNGNRCIAARCGVIRSKDVESLTVLILFRLRFSVKRKDNNSPSVVEECIVTGFQGMIDSAKWLSIEEAVSLFENTVPSHNMSDEEKRYWVTTILKDFNEIQKKTESLICSRAEILFQSYERLRQTIKGSQIVVESLLPADVLSVSVIVPHSKV
jgi:hypothetical protein